MDLPFLESRGGRSLDELLALEGTYRTDSLVLAMEEGLLEKETVEGDELVVVAVEAFEREVNNGGFAQLFENAAFVVAHVAASLRAIGCPETAVLVDRAYDALGLPADADPDAAAEAVANADDDVQAALAELDDAFFDVEGECIEDALFAWVRAHRDGIVLGA